MDEQIPRGTALWSDTAVVHFDGSCQPPRGGVAGYGFTVEGAFDYEECGLAVRPGAAHATNNVAEYAGAISALEWLLRRGFRGPVVLRGDSQLVIRQMRGEYEVRADHLKAYHDRLEGLAKEFGRVAYDWIPREENRRADALSKLAVDRAGRAGADPAPRPGA